MQQPLNQAVTLPDCSQEKAVFDRALLEIRRILSETNPRRPLEAWVIDRLERARSLPALPVFFELEDPRQIALANRARKLSDVLARLPEMHAARPLDGAWATLIADEITNFTHALDQAEAEQRAEAVQPLDPAAADEVSADETTYEQTPVDAATTELDLKPVEASAPDADQNKNTLEKVDDVTNPENPSPAEQMIAEKNNTVELLDASTRRERDPALDGLVMRRLSDDGPDSSDPLAADAPNGANIAIDGADIRPVPAEQRRGRPIKWLLLGSILIVAAFAGGLTIYQTGIWRMVTVPPWNEETSAGVAGTPPLPIEKPRKVSARAEPSAPADEDGQSESAAPADVQVIGEAAPVQPIEPPLSEDEQVEMANAEPPAASGVLSLPGPDQTPPPTLPQPRPATPSTSSIASTNSIFAGKFAVQVGSYQSMPRAKEGWAAFQRTHGDQLAGLTHEFVRVDIPGRGEFIRLRIGAFETNGQASQFCFNIKQSGGSCIIANP